MTEPDMTISLCVTAHRVHYLAECLISIAAQSNKKFDLILCADTKGDPAVEVIFAEFAPFIVANRIEVVTVAAGTAGIARNAAFSRATTQWITYLDGDDLIRPDAMSELMSALESGATHMVSTGLFGVDSTGARVAAPASLHYRPPLWIYHTDPRTMRHWAFFNQLLAITRESWLRYPFVEFETNREDIDFVLHQLLYGECLKIPLALYGYRQSADGFSTRRYPGGDICEQRYNTGYYSRLFLTMYTPALAGNFA